jgi:hypothetical protein
VCCPLFGAGTRQKSVVAKSYQVTPTMNQKTANFTPAMKHFAYICIENQTIKSSGCHPLYPGRGMGFFGTNHNLGWICRIAIKSA